MLNVQEPAPRDQDFEVHEAISMERTLNDSSGAIGKDSIFEPERSMRTQIELWEHSVPQQRGIKAISDSYNEEMTTITSNFLLNMRQVILAAEERLRLKRKDLTATAAHSIHQKWKVICQELTKAMFSWCAAS